MYTQRSTAMVTYIYLTHGKMSKTIGDLIEVSQFRSTLSLVIFMQTAWLIQLSQT